MPLYYFLLSLVMLSVIITLLRYYFFQKTNRAVVLFMEALKVENSGSYETALIMYKEALGEVGKIRFHNRLKEKIVEKIRVMEYLINYNAGLHYTRA